MSASASDFTDIVWPSLVSAGKIVPGRVIQVEYVSEGWFNELLDTSAGIDYWRIIDGASGPLAIQGIATRVQWGTPYASITVRTKRESGCRTEIHKLRDAIGNSDNAHLRPGLHIQAYLDEKGGKLLYACVARSIDLLKYCDQWAKADGVTEMMNPVDRSWFLPVWVALLRSHGYGVREFIATGIEPRQRRQEP